MPIKRIQDDDCRRRNIHYEYDTDATPIGQGGMGVVYRGIRVDDSTGIRTDVAIKVLHDNLPDEVYARAAREASIQIRHTNLVEMFGLISEYEVNRFGISRTVHYVISELLHGIDLSDLLTGKFDNSDGTENSFAKGLYSRYIKDRKGAAIEIMRSISSGVLALHDNGYIHRDIDPSNIMVTNDGQIKLIDFGIAKNLNTINTNDKLTTSTGQFMGKAEYASPELVLGDVKNHNYTTDIYALGILLFRLLTGRLPFSGPQYEVQQKQLKSRVPLRLVEEVALAKVIKRATQKSQSARYASVAEFRVALDIAARSNRRNVPSWIYGVAASLVVLAGCGAAWYALTGEPEDLVPTQREQFTQALAMLNANDADSVKAGFDEMRSLAAAGYDSAKVEIGLTYIPYLSGGSLADSLAHPILKRRYHLNLTSASDADSVISYLKGSSALPPEASYLLGCTYTQTGKVDEALEMFRKTQRAIDNANAAGHGYDTDTLKRIVSYNIGLLQDR